MTKERTKGRRSLYSPSSPVVPLLLSLHSPAERSDLREGESVARDRPVGGQEERVRGRFRRRAAKALVTLSIRRPQGPPTRRNERSEWRGEADGRGRFTPYGGRPATARRREWPTAREEGDRRVARE